MQAGLINEPDLSGLYSCPHQHCQARFLLSNQTGPKLLSNARTPLCQQLAWERRQDFTSLNPDDPVTSQRIARHNSDLTRLQELYDDPGY